MEAPPSPETPKKKSPTASEAMFFFAIVKHMKNKAEIDWSAVASEQGFKSADVAKVRFGQVKRKLGISNDHHGTTIKAESELLKTPTKVVKTPSRRSGAKAKGRNAKAKKESDTEEDMDTLMTTNGGANGILKMEVDRDDNMAIKTEGGSQADPFHG